MTKNKRANPRRTFGRTNDQYTRKAEAAENAIKEEEDKNRKEAEEIAAENENAERIRILRDSVAEESSQNPTVFRRHVVYPNGRQEYYDQGWRLHRDSGPAVIPPDGPPEFWQHGELFFPN